MIARMKVNSDAEAEDAVHTCFLKLAEKFSKYRNLPYKKLVSICRKTTRNAAVDITRKYKNVVMIPGDEDYGVDYLLSLVGMDILDQVIKDFEVEAIVKAIKELEEEERDLLYMRYELEQKPKEIGHLMNMSSAEVRKKLFDYRNKLAKILQEQGFENEPE